MSTQEHVDRLVAARLAADILGTSTIIVARTDAEAATLLDSNIDKRDHPFILGVTNTSVNSLYDTLVKAKTSGCSDMDRVSKDWTPRAGLKTFGNAVLGKIEKLNASDWKKETMKQQWLSHDPNTLSNAQARRVADSIFGQKGSVR